MRKPTKAEKILIGAILVLATAVVMYVFLYKHIVGLRADLSEVSRELESVEKIVENKNDTITLLRETEEGRRELEKYFVSANDPTQFLDMIDAVAEDVGVTVSSPSVEIVGYEELDKNFPDELQKKTDVLLSVSGEWDEIYHFISLLELFPYVVTVDRVTVAYKEGDEGSWEGVINIHTNAI